MSNFSNDQWAVTDLGIESIKPAPAYFIEANRLTETTDRGGGSMYDWPIHMAEKTWIDLEAFIEAFKKGLETHAGKYKPALNQMLLKTSIDEARKEAKRV